MRSDHEGVPNARRIRAMAQALHDTYLTCLSRGNWCEHLGAVVLFVDLVLSDIELAQAELDDFSPLPGELREFFVWMVRGGYAD